MKKTFIHLGLALLCLLAIAACDNKKGNKVIDEDNDLQEIVDDEYDAEADNDEDAPDADVLADGDDVDGDASWEEEVWTTFGGTYFFWSDGGSIVLDFPLMDEVRPVKFTYGDDEYEATVNEETGLIIATDDDGNEVFRGAVYAGGNLLKGTYKGEEVKAWGAGD